MKSFILGLVLMAVVVSLGTVHAVLMNNYIDEIMQYADAVIYEIGADNFDNAYKEYEKMSESLDKHDTFLASTMQHTQLQDLKRSMLRLEQFLQDNDAENALYESNEAKFLMGNIADDTKINIKNIL